MKLSAHAFTRFWDVHAWSGVLGGLVLFLVFLTGGLTLFRHELEVWQDPLAQRAPVPGTHQALLDRALARLPKKPDSLWFYAHAPGAARIGYSDPETGEWQVYWIDGESGALLAQRERLAELFYDLHFLWHDLTGIWLYRASGLVAALLLLVLVTGVLIHLKDLVRQLHQFRPDKSRRVFWSDMHKVLGVMGLPFQLLYAYTGAFIVLGPLLAGVFAGPVFDGDPRRAEAALWGGPPRSAREPGPPAPHLPIDALAARARAIEPRFVPELYHVVHQGKQNGFVEVRGVIEGTTPEAHATIHLATVDGRVLHVDTPTTETSAGATWRWNAGLHFGDFGGPTLRVLFLALALATCATFLTGNWIWLARRQARAQSVGNRILARLTVGFGMGTLVAVALVVLASRLFPLEWTARATAEELTFFGALAACIAWAFAARNEARLWWQGLALAGSALLPVPLLATRWSEAGLFGSGPHIAAVVGVDVGFLVAAFALLASALALRTAFARNGGKRDAIRVTVKPDAAQEASIAPGLTLARAEHNALEGS